MMLKLHCVTGRCFSAMIWADTSDGAHDVGGTMGTTVIWFEGSIQSDTGPLMIVNENSRCHLSLAFPGSLPRMSLSWSASSTLYRSKGRVVEPPIDKSCYVQYVPPRFPTCYDTVGWVGAGRVCITTVQRPDQIYLLGNSSGDFTVAKEAPRSIKHFRWDTWRYLIFKRNKLTMIWVMILRGPSSRW
jgi:hypothetical protein